MKKSAPTVFLFAALLSAVGPVEAQTATHREFLGQYCTGCHNDTLKSGGLSLVALQKTLAGDISTGAERWEKVIRRVRAGMMPPASAKRPDDATATAFVHSIETALDQSARLHPNPGRPLLHRLNRTEYANSVHDLLGVDIDAQALLPPDDMSHGFDNMTEALTVSPALMEAYLRAAGRISRTALGDAGAAPQMVNYTLPRVVSQLRHVDGAPAGTRGGISVVHNFPADAEYSFRLTFYFHQMGTTIFGQQAAKDEEIEVSINGERVAVFHVDPRMKQFDDLRTPPVFVKAGPQRVSAAFISRSDGPVEDTIAPIEQSLVDINVAGIPGLSTLPHLHDLVVEGPHNATGVSESPARRRIFTCRPVNESSDLPCAKEIISKLAASAFRRPVNDSDLDRLLSYYVSGKKQDGFESGIRTAIQAILANPEFVFRFEFPPDGAVSEKNYRVADLELASRLSYFLWSSAPDKELLQAAGNNRLHESAELEKQVRRMLADPRSQSLATNFARQWLNLQNLKSVLPDPLTFPNFDRNLAVSMERETELFFDSILREDRGITDLLTANYTFVDERLAKHYGIPNVLGSQFRRVPLTDPNRFGLLGQGSILTLTSIANRTSPVQRGKYVMNILLGVPAPTPPPNVPPLKETVENTKPVSVRERMEQHREKEPCHSCHQLMDPIGFALENFDAVGVWRITDSGFPVDTAGKLFDGTAIDGPAALRIALVKRSGAFISGFTENFLAYGLGRVTDYRDMPAVRGIIADAAKNNYRLSSFVLAVVKSLPFQMSRVEDNPGITAQHEE